MAGVQYKAPDAMLRRLSATLVGVDQNTISMVANAVCQDIAENPITPTPDQWKSLPASPHSSPSACQMFMATAFQTIMFAVADPDEPIADLLVSPTPDKVREAFQRGIVNGKQA